MDWLMLAAIIVILMQIYCDPKFKRAKVGEKR